MIVAGIGCRARCPAEAIVALVRDAETRSGHTADALATPAHKADTAPLRDAARNLRLPLLPVAPDALRAAAPLCTTRSAASLAATGLPSVAEAAALAATGPGARLLLPRIASPLATCALAEAPAPC